MSSVPTSLLPSKIVYEKLGENTDRYMYEKAKIEKQMPAIRSMTADNYALTRLDASGLETPEYTHLRASAEKNIRKREAKSKLLSDSDDHTAAEKAGAKFLNSLRNDYRLQFGIGEGSLLYRRNTFRNSNIYKICSPIKSFCINSCDSIWYS